MGWLPRVVSLGKLVFGLVVLGEFCLGMLHVDKDSLSGVCSQKLSCSSGRFSGVANPRIIFCPQGWS